MVISAIYFYDYFDNGEETCLMWILVSIKMTF